ncbi:hypothetical protein OsJ_31144 [Oryza sativa Japonica Group]|uniref:Uncharacterized protein n=1 Tax=Oryza sativa subsp. japonica TaxID=39947 RepID=B9G850_ORYSJ|nr:hypothetical protein OsJ_31144 [Oryza sativa Japonica Group]
MEPRISRETGARHSMRPSTSVSASWPSTVTLSTECIVPTVVSPDNDCFANHTTDCVTGCDALLLAPKGNHVVRMNLTTLLSDKLKPRRRSRGMGW